MTHSNILDNELEQLTYDQELKISKRVKQKEPYTPFLMVGKYGFTKVRGLPTMNAAVLMMEFSVNEAWLMKLIYQEYDSSNNKVTIRAKSLNATERRRMLSVYKSLRAKDVIRRVRREHYMVNPMFWIPRANRQAAVDEYRVLDLPGNKNKSAALQALNNTAPNVVEADQIASDHRFANTKSGGSNRKQPFNQVHATMQKPANQVAQPVPAEGIMNAAVGLGSSNLTGSTTEPV